MARPSKAAPIDYGATHVLTHGLLERATCPADGRFVLLKDADTKGLRLRVTQAGGKFWQFETRMKGKLITRSLGEWPAVSFAEAQTQARTLRNMTAQGIDPREIERQQQTEREAAAVAEAAQAVTVGEAWATYVEARRQHWAPLSLRDNVNAATAGGVPRKRGEGLTTPGPLHIFMSLHLLELTHDAVQTWAEREGKERPTRARSAGQGQAENRRPAARATARLVHRRAQYGQRYRKCVSAMPAADGRAPRRAAELALG